MWLFQSLSSSVSLFLKNSAGLYPIAIKRLKILVCRPVNTFEVRSRYVLFLSNLRPDYISLRPAPFDYPSLNLSSVLHDLLHFSLSELTKFRECSFSFFCCGEILLQHIVVIIKRYGETEKFWRFFAVCQFYYRIMSRKCWPKSNRRSLTCAPFVSCVRNEIH